MTDLPKALPPAARRRPARRPCRPSTESVSDGGDTVKWLWRLADGVLDRDGAHALPRPDHGVRQHAGRLRDGLRVLRHRPGRLRPAPDAPARSSSRSSRRPTGPGPRRLSQRGVHGHGRAAGQLRRDVGRGRAAPRRHRDLGPPHHRVDRRHRARHPAAGRRAPAGQPGRVAARGQRRAARRAGADQPALPARRAGRGLPGLPARPSAAGCRSSGRSSTGSTTATSTPPSWPPTPARCGPTSTSSRSTRRPATRRGAARRPGCAPSATGWPGSGVNATVRRNRGTDIDAACGQLRANHEVAVRRVEGRAGRAEAGRTSTVIPGPARTASTRTSDARTTAPGHTTERHDRAGLDHGPVADHRLARPMRPGWRPGTTPACRNRRSGPLRPTTSSRPDAAAGAQHLGVEPGRLGAQARGHRATAAACPPPEWPGPRSRRAGPGHEHPHPIAVPTGEQRRERHVGPGVAVDHDHGPAVEPVAEPADGPGRAERPIGLVETCGPGGAA